MIKEVEPGAFGILSVDRDGKIVTANGRYLFYAKGDYEAALVSDFPDAAKLLVDCHNAMVGLTLSEARSVLSAVKALMPKIIQDRAVYGSACFEVSLMDPGEVVFDAHQD